MNVFNLPYLLDQTPWLLFHRAILCAFYSRAAFFKLSVIGKISRNCKGFEKSQFYKITKNCDAVTWFWSKPSSLISRRSACPEVRRLIERRLIKQIRYLRGCFILHMEVWFTRVLYFASWGVIANSPVWLGGSIVLFFLYLITLAKYVFDEYFRGQSYKQVFFLAQPCGHLCL